MNKEKLSHIPALLLLLLIAAIRCEENENEIKIEIENQNQNRNKNENNLHGQDVDFEFPQQFVPIDFCFGACAADQHSICIDFECRCEFGYTRKSVNESSSNAKTRIPNRCTKINCTIGADCGGGPNAECRRTTSGSDSNSSSNSYCECAEGFKLHPYRRQCVPKLDSRTLITFFVFSSLIPICWVLIIVCLIFVQSSSSTQTCYRAFFAQHPVFSRLFPGLNRNTTPSAPTSDRPPSYRQVFGEPGTSSATSSWWPWYNRSQWRCSSSTGNTNVPRTLTLSPPNAENQNFDFRKCDLPPSYGELFDFVPPGAPRRSISAPETRTERVSPTIPSDNHPVSLDNTKLYL